MTEIPQAALETGATTLHDLICGPADLCTLAADSDHRSAFADLARSMLGDVWKYAADDYAFERGRVAEREQACEAVADYIRHLAGGPDESDRKHAANLRAFAIGLFGMDPLRGQDGGTDGQA